MRMLCVAALVLAPGLAGATQLEIGSGQEQLTNGLADGWFYFAGLRQQQDAYGWGGRYQRSERFGLQDQEWLFDGNYKLNNELTWLWQAAYSPQNRVRPELNYGSQLAWSWTPGWVVTPGVMLSQDDEQDSHSYSLMNEHYIGAYRLAYTFYHSRPEDAGTANTHLLQLSYYFNDTDSITLLAVRGKELERLPNRVLVMDVSRYGFFGQLGLSPNWQLLYNASWSEQDVLYEKTEYGLSVRYSF
ncbi:YaiO family outer membrane beta-barrel protein [Rheinheimera sp.]|uniref:YaiO family outer membrane beta-barrel protein n=1 Tax=Rheinheimera sp. TaxID=1869214 RepID=UPI003AF68B68